uniref:Uncharacterized protein n=1 Tax=Glossina austeni TaxID=7395 RepID=A0A1A9V534_GLOAU
MKLYLQSEVSQLRIACDTPRGYYKLLTSIRLSSNSSSVKLQSSANTVSPIKLILLCVNLRTFKLPRPLNISLVAEPDEMRSLRLRPSLSRERPSITAGKQANIITEIIGRRDMTLYLAGANILMFE